MNGSARRADSEVSDTTVSFTDNEWRMLRAVRPNILIIGAEAASAPAVATIVGGLPGTVSYLAPNAPPPDGGEEDAEVVIVPDVAALTADRQREWLNWLSQIEERRPQIVATSTVPLYPLVVKETFLEELYYRLNTILVDVQERGSAAYRPY